MNQWVARDQFSAGGLALLVHLFFFAALVFGVSWKTLPEVPVYADLWNALPSQPAPRLPPPPEPEPLRPPTVQEPVKVAPPPPKVDPDIALKEKKAKETEKKKQEQKRLEEEKARQAAQLKQRQEEEKKLKLEEEKKRRLEEEKRQKAAEQQRRLDEEMARMERERLAQEEKQLQLRKEQEKKAAEAKRLAQEKARKDMEAMLAAEMAGDLDAEARVISQQAAVKARMKLVDEYKLRIQAKIKGLLINPPGLSGKPEATYRVDLLPNGEVVRATLLRTSGQPAYDRAVESAILKASPLPLPPDKDAAAAFRDGLELRFRPD